MKTFMRTPAIMKSMKAKMRKSFVHKHEEVVCNVLPEVVETAQAESKEQNESSENGELDMVSESYLLEQLNNLFKSFNIKAAALARRKAHHFYSVLVKLESGTKLKKLESIATEIQLALRLGSKPVFLLEPQQGLVRMVFVSKQETIMLSELLKDRQSAGPTNSELKMIVGVQSDGVPLEIDLVQAPHMIVAGATGSGKSVFLHAIIHNLLKKGEDRVGIFLADPKVVEFQKYKEGYTNVRGVFNDYESIIRMLYGLQRLVEKRYEILANAWLRSIDELPVTAPIKMERIVVIIDEVADLMLQDRRKKLFETLICSIAAKSRAAGVHLILATQRPSVNVITGLIKANFPVRVAFKVSAGVDSRVVLDSMGAENLLAKGDGILSGYDNFGMMRFQSAFVDVNEMPTDMKKPALRLVR